MYSVRVYCMHSRKGLIVRYLTFETYTRALNCWDTLTGKTTRKEYPKSLYFDIATITHTSIGEMLTFESVECELLLEYLDKTI